MATDTRYIGKPVNRVDGPQKVTGTATYAGDFRFPGMLYASLKSSPIPSGTIRSIDTADAEKAPGVHLVLTHLNRGPMETPQNEQVKSKLDEPRLPLADARIYRAGQYIAMIVAESFDQATYAGSLIRVEYEEEPFNVDPDKAGDTEFPAGEASSGDELQVCRGDVDQGLADSEIRLDATYVTPMEHPSPMEPHATVAVWEDEMLTVYDATQWVMGDQNAFTTAFRLKDEQVRVLAPFVGGMFGSKATIGGHALLTGLAAMRLGRPVKTVLSREQVFSSVGHRTDTRQRFEIGAKRDGTMMAMRHSTRTHFSMDEDQDDFIEPVSLSSRMLYAVPNYQSQHTVVRINVVRPSWMRAPGECPCQYAMEVALDELAYACRMDPIELRRRNDTKVNLQKQTPFSERRMMECFDRGAERFGWSQRSLEPGSMRDGDTLVGWGVAAASYPGNIYGATVRVRLELHEGRARGVVSTAGIDVGTGMYTMLAMTAAEGLALPLERVTSLLGDSKLSNCVYAGGSNLTASTAPPAMAACRDLRTELAKAAGKLLRLDGAVDEFVFRDGTVAHRDHPGRTIRYEELLQQTGSLESEHKSEKVPGQDEHFTYHSTGAQFAEVRVQPDLGRIRVTRIVSVFDVGRVLNAKAARSQLIGGIVFGVGAALLEKLTYDAHGKPINANLAEYLVPVSTDIPEIDVSWLDEPDYRFNSLGCRGVGEIGITGSVAAVANAVFHATGRRIRDLPITAEKLFATR